MQSTLDLVRARFVLLGAFACAAFAAFQAFQGAPHLAAAWAAAAVLLAGPPRVAHLPWQPTLVTAALAALITAAFTLATRDGMPPWQVPATAADLLRITRIGGALLVALYLTYALSTQARMDRPATPWTHLAWLGIVPVFNALLALSSTPLMEALGHVETVDAPYLARWFGRVTTVFLVNEAILLGSGWLLDRRGTLNTRLHLLMLGCAAYVASTPAIADLASFAGLYRLPAILHAAVAITLSALSQGGLWAETFLLTGILLDALLGRRPTWLACSAHARGGLARGTIYAGAFMALVMVIALLRIQPWLMGPARSHPVLASIVAGAAFFPLLKTVVESFDGSAPFFGRLRAAWRDRRNVLRGAIAGLGVGIALAIDLPAAPVMERFLAGVAIGALTYAGADLLVNAAETMSGRRQHLQSGRVYLLGTLLGGFVGGALAWYVDTAQLAAVIGKFHQYATLSYDVAGRAAQQYVVYPLFSKYGAIDLGSVHGGVKLLYVEALSGVINWSLAAPLFSINLIVLSALFARSLAPLRRLFTGAGIATLVEQAVRVLRWGLWMAPVIYTFLRLAPDPTWYNQDGLVRTVVATVQAIRLSPADFHAWGLSVFLGLLAYDALRVLIWFDHMGLRVATLVNLSFIGGDALDEKAARFVGHSARTRVIPEGIRRFLTWAPLLIPFYIPRGVEWDTVWGQAEGIANAAGPLLPAVATLLVGYRIAAVLIAAGAIALIARAWRAPRGDEGSARPLPAPFTAGNGQYFVEMHRDGRGYSRCHSEVRDNFVLDLTRRPDDPLQVRGKFLYLRDPSPGGVAWSLAPEPMRGAAAMAVRQVSPVRLELRASQAGIDAHCIVEIQANEPAETWTLSLSNPGDLPRTIEVTTYQELAAGPVDAYRRTPAFAGMHVGTTFVRGLGAILVRNRLMKTQSRNPAKVRMSRELAFHATDAPDSGPVRLIGYEDSRVAFLGGGTPAAPDAIGRSMRLPTDEGLLYTLDPCASLRVRVDIPARGKARVRFADGYAHDETTAIRRIARLLGRTENNVGEWRVSIERHRHAWFDKGVSTADPFSPDGREVRVPPGLQRPWSHVIANALGHGVVVSSDGATFAFAGNAQQNALTPPSIEAGPAQQPGELMLVFDRDRGDVHGAAQIPVRRAGVQPQVRFAPGLAHFAQAHDGLELELDLFACSEQPAQLRRLRITNRSDATRRLRALAYAGIVLAETASDSRGRLETRSSGGILLFRHPHNDFRQGWAFAASNLPDGATLETRRARVFGAVFDAAAPHLLVTGTANPQAADDGARCAAFCGDFDLAPGETREIVLVLGQAADADAAVKLAALLKTPAIAAAELERVHAFWRERLDVLRIDTGDAAFDRLVNTWLPYQVLAARLWGRTGPNQRSGAFGFRDQLQDVLPFAILDPALARRQILLHAAQQFREGDVLKWWHDSWQGRTGIGVRTIASDPHLWLPYVVLRYVKATGDTSVYDERLPFLEGAPVPPGHEGFMLAPRTSRDDASVYDHCRLAIERALADRGPSGLPLLGSGDWNDGLDAAGLARGGESTWTAFFLHDVLRHFADVTAVREWADDAARYRKEAARVRQATESMWRPPGYVRATDDDGIEFAYTDALTASWSVLSGAVDLARGIEVLDHSLSVLERDTRVLLLSPPFTDHSEPYPGRLAEYPPGLRENGGQYSHGVSWFVDAWLRIAELAREQRRPEVVERARARALELWIKISPLSKVTAAELSRYGLSPHQQPADIDEGPGYEGRGGWSWYTGAAARMLSAAHGLCGISMENGQLKVRAQAAKPMVSVSFRGQVVEPEK